MTPARAAAYIGGTSLLVAWLAAAAGVQRPAEPRAVERRPESVQVDALAADVQSQAVRLRARMAAAPAERLSARNPFAFDSRPAPEPRRSVAAVGAPTASPDSPPSDVPLELIGVAERVREGTTTRTAVVTAPGDQLFLVTVGQEVAGRYRVSAVGADAVELTDLATGATRRLGLR